MRRSLPSLLGALVLLGGVGLGSTAIGAAEPQAIHHAAQGANWTPALRDAFYRLDQGSRLIPLAWLKALRQPDGAPFLADALARYGFLPNSSPNNPDALPLGFSVAASAQGPTAGLTCAACHTRDIEAEGQTWRIEGGPAFIDFQNFLSGLDASVLRVLASDAAFDPFAKAVLGPDAAKAADVANLRAAVGLWSLRFHTWLRGLPEKRHWGPARLDAFGMIFNRLTGLDIGQQPSYLIPENITKADAPARYPFLWNSSIQDRTDWAGFAANGNDQYALARNLGEVLGVFAIFHPRPLPPKAPLNFDYLTANSGNFVGLATLETMVVALKPPAWPWPVDTALAAKGATVFNLPTDQGGCVDCHGIKPGENRGPRATWKTPVLDVGTDTRMWAILQRPAKAGAFAGAFIPGITTPLSKTDSVANILKTAVIGAIAQEKARTSGPVPKPTAARQAGMSEAVRLPGESAKALPSKEKTSGYTSINQYESRVLQGIWAAAPYLHNGSVPTLADLLKPAEERTKHFRIGPAYDIETVGLAIDQPASTFTLDTTGCADLDSGDSNCGHAYGTHLSDPQKKALLEYLKTL